MYFKNVFINSYEPLKLKGYKMFQFFDEKFGDFGKLQFGCNYNHEEVTFILFEMV
jgi:hypothetical protein